LHQIRSRVPICSAAPIQRQRFAKPWFHEAHSNSGVRIERWLLGLVAITFALTLTPAMSRAANPSNGTVSAGNTVVNWSGDFLPPSGASTCGGPGNTGCDNFQLNII